MEAFKKNIKILSFEQAINELEEIVRLMETSSVELDSAIELYSRGIELKKHCEHILSKAKLKVEKITIKENLNLEVEPI